MTDQDHVNAINLRVETDAEHAYIQGRNGLAPIKQIAVWSYNGGRVYLNGIGRRGQEINGGLCIDRAAWDALVAAIKALPAEGE